MTTPWRQFSLLHDDALVLRISDDALAVASPWIPLHADVSTHEQPSGARATIDVEISSRDHVRGEIDQDPLVLFGGVHAIVESADVILLTASSPARGRIELGARRARIRIPDGPHDDARHARLAADVYSMLTLSAAFLIGRLGGALVHAGCVVDPEGRAWPLVGDSHAGKTTTCVSLVAHGWRFLADDQIVLRPHIGDTRAIDVQGWPRHAHLDEGWSDAVVTGTRGAVDLRARWGELWERNATLGGLLLPAVRADAPTSVTRAHEATAFTALVRQSPWLMADPGAAPAVMSLLRAASARPTFALSLGQDSYARGEVLNDRLAVAREAATSFDA